MEGRGKPSTVFAEGGLECREELRGHNILLWVKRVVFQFFPTKTIVFVTVKVIILIQWVCENAKACQRTMRVWHLLPN